MFVLNIALIFLREGERTKHFQNYIYFILFGDSYPIICSASFSLTLLLYARSCKPLEVIIPKNDYFIDNT